MIVEDLEEWNCFTDLYIEPFDDDDGTGSDRNNSSVESDTQETPSRPAVFPPEPHLRQGGAEWSDG